MGYRDGYIVKNQHDIGGRATDLSQIGYSLTHMVREAFPINEVPKEYVEALRSLQKLLELAERELGRAMEFLKEPE